MSSSTIFWRGEEHHVCPVIAIVDDRVTTRPLIFYEQDGRAFHSTPACRNGRAFAVFAAGWASLAPTDKGESGRLNRC